MRGGLSSNGGGFEGINSTRCGCVWVCVGRRRVRRERLLMKWFVTSLMTKETRFHRQGITDVKTNLGPLKDVKGSFVRGPPIKRAI